ncbi:recombinase family protein [Bacteroides hominis]|uniref:recombinase family protein n=1 Tax=Bacteroides hominis TaxID=2763023 RepID=UPI00164CC74F|nr:recombinase family protein [Bacteroides hominis (ex Liu et al. 2022)]MBC5614617.1 recombinase family protein [Bacteroides hominis (ex Liu et al. 2022)]
MAKVGYIFRANSYDAFDADKEWMQQYGCVQVFEETIEHEMLRPMWKQLMSNLERGDELVVAKFSNAVRDLRELGSFIELCRIRVVRIISIHDKIDTRGELFPDTTVTEVLNMFGAFPEEVAVLRKSSDHIMRLQQEIKVPATITTKKVKDKNKRDETIVRMYNNGHSIEDIWAASGFSSKSSIWRILNNNGVKLDRGRASGPRAKNKKDGAE